MRKIDIKKCRSKSIINCLICDKETDLYSITMNSWQTTLCKDHLKQLGKQIETITKE